MSLIQLVRRVLGNPDFVERPHWGGYLDLYRSDELVIKILYFRPYGKLSLQKHMERSEQWQVLHGELNIAAYYDEAYALETYHQPYPGPSTLAGDTEDIPINAWHHAEAGHEHALVLETQIGRCSEDDIVRIAGYPGDAT